MADARPMVMAVDAHQGARVRLVEELEGRYGEAYRVVCLASAAEALDALEQARRDGDAVVVVLADPWLPGTTGADLLERAQQLHPRSKRALLIEFGAWGDPPTAATIRRAMALGHIDYYVLKPWRPNDELFHRTLGEFLHEWARSDSPEPREIAVVADPTERRGHELRSLLARNGVPHVFHEREGDDGRRLLELADATEARGPVVITLDGSVLIDPSNAQLARSYGVSTELAGSSEFDIAIVGAGPAGLAAAVYAVSEGYRALVVERESIGGQAGTSSRIRNYLGFPRGVSGAELAQRAYQQAWVFGADFLLMRDATSLHAGEGAIVLTVSDRTEITSRAVILAMGVTYQRLRVDALEQLINAGVYYGASVSEAQACTDREVFVVGGGNSAGQAALHLGRYARRVTLLVRKPLLAASMSSYLRDEITAAANIEVRLATEIVDGGGDGRLEFLTLHETASGARETVNADALFVLIGARPRTDWLPDDIVRDTAGYVLTGHDTGSVPPTRMFETSTRGVFAVGDVRAGSVKRVASAVGEGSVVIQQVGEHLGAR
jgi:thioredoxin reductase (NADPH)